jgi:hypothetical protein
MTELYNRLYNHIRSNLVARGDGAYVAEWDYRGSMERYVFTNQSLSEFVDDVLNGVPMTSMYRNAVNMLLVQEAKLPSSPDVYCIIRKNDAIECDYTKYMAIRARMLNVENDTPSYRKGIMQDLLNLGRNPTQTVGNNPSEYKFNCTLLVSGLYRTKQDYSKDTPACRKTFGDIKTNLFKDLMRNPILALQSNEYAYSALTQYAIKA